MGWSFTHRRFESVKQFCEHEFLDGYYDNIVKYSIVGNKFWAVMKNNSGTKFIFLALIAKEGGYYGYKPLDESMHPYHYNCPISLIKLCDEPLNNDAREWREKVIAFHAKKKETKIKLEVNQTFKYSGAIYTAKEYLGKRGYLVTRSDGAVFRMPNTRIKKIELIA